MGKLFWIGSGVGLVAAAGLWVGVTWQIGDDVAGLRSKVDDRRDELHVWATPGPGKKQKFDDIVNQSFIGVENAYKQGLAATRTELLKQMRARNMSIDPAIWDNPPDKPPPMHDVSRFRTWLTDEYAKRNGKLREAGIVVPDDPVGLGEVPDWDDVVKEDLPRILREYRVSCEVFRAIAEASAKVRYRARVKDENGVMQVIEGEGEQEKRVIEIEGLRFDERRSGAAPAPAPKAGEKPPLFREHTFTVKFNAHHGAAFDLIRRLEESKAGVFVVRTAEVSRIDRLEIKGRDSDDEANPYKNRIKDEAPVVVEVTASLLEFIGQEGG